jgi:hypothetical protein
MTWYYTNQGQNVGPVEQEVFENLVRQGLIRDDTMVWTDGMTVWQPYATVKQGPPQWAQAGTVVMNTVPMAPAALQIPSYALYNSFGVALAALFGSPLAGAFLMALNYRRMGQRGRFWSTLAIGIGVTALAMGVSYLLPSSVATGLGIGLVAGIRQVARSTQGDAIDAHVAQGGKVASGWAAFGVGVAGLTALVAVIFGGVLGFELLNGKPKIKIGQKDEVYYSGTATKNDAQALGEALKATGYFTDKGVSVLLSREGTSTAVAFVVKEGAWDSKEMVAAYEEIGRQVAPSVGGFPVTVRLADSAQQTKKEMTVGKIKVGTKDDVYYFGMATESDAKSLGEALQKAGYFLDRGTSVLLTKDEDGTAVAFVVREGYWEDPAHIAGFQQVVEKCASALGGLPVRMRLVNPGLEVKKEVVVSAKK